MTKKAKAEPVASNPPTEGGIGDFISTIIDKAGKIDFVRLAGILKELYQLWPKSAGNGCHEDGSCDHAACAQNIVRLQLQALDAAVAHACACCDEGTTKPSEGDEE